MENQLSSFFSFTLTTTWAVEFKTVHFPLFDHWCRRFVKAVITGFCVDIIFLVPKLKSTRRCESWEVGGCGAKLRSFKHWVSNVAEPVNANLVSNPWRRKLRCWMHKVIAPSKVSQLRLTWPYHAHIVEENYFIKKYLWGYLMKLILFEMKESHKILSLLSTLKVIESHPTCVGNNSL